MKLIDRFKFQYYKRLCEVTCKKIQRCESERLSYWIGKYSEYIGKIKKIPLQ